MTMSKRPNVVPVIVEGPTEELALGLVFSQLFRAMGRLHFEVVHGDLLTQQRFCVTPGGNAESKRVDEWVRKGILDYLQGLSPKITWNDLACIIQITDTDAAFVPEELAPDHLVHRNEIKRGNARILARKSAFTFKKRTVPYSLYYFSQDMEDALHGIHGSELTPHKKELLARAFQQRYARDLEGFRTLLEELLPCRKFRDSWEYIFENGNSMNRASNLALAFRKANKASA